MANYTPDEIQAVVEKLVLSTIRRPYDTLGVRRTDISFSDVQQAAAGVFLLYPMSPFYTLYLGVQRVGDLIASEVEIVESLLDALGATGRNVLPVEDVSTLFNAQAALQALASAAAQQKGATDVTKAPAYVRFTDNVGRFLGGPGQNVREAGAVVQTPQQARAAIPALLTQLQDAHEVLVGRLKSISGGMADYNGLNLPSLVSTSVLANAASLVGADADALNALTPTERLALIRQTVLNILSVKAVVQTFSSFQPPSDFYPLEGLGRPYSDAKHLATPASATSSAKDVYGVLSTNDTLVVAVDGGAASSIVLQHSTLAELAGFATDDKFIIGDGTNPVTLGAPVPLNNVLRVTYGSVSYNCALTLSAAATGAVVTGTGDTTTAGWYGAGGSLNGTTLSIVVDGVATYTVTFAAPATASAMVTAINNVTNVAGAQHRVLASTSSNRLVLTTQSSTGVSASILMGSGTANSILGFTGGSTVNGNSNPRTADQVAADLNASLPAGEVVAEGYFFPRRFAGSLDIPASAGPTSTWTTTAGASGSLLSLGVVVGDVVQVMGGTNAGFWTITAVTATTVTVSGATAAQASASVEIGPKNRALRIRCVGTPSQLSGELSLQLLTDTTASKNAATTFGFPSGLVSTCAPTSMDALAADITAKSAAITASVVADYDAGLIAVRARTEPTNASQVTFASLETLGAVTFGAGTADYTVTSIVAGTTTQTGDVLVLRNSGIELVVNTINGLPATSPRQVVVGDVINGLGGPGTSGTNVRAEFGPPVTAARYNIVDITGGPNNGRYIIASPGPSSLDVQLLGAALPLVQSGTTYVEMVASFGSRRLQLASKLPTTQSRIQVTALDTLFSLAVDNYGTTPWFQLPSLPRGLQTGDVLEVHDTVYNTPSGEHIVGSVDTSLALLGISPEIGSSVTWQFTPQPPPFARLRAGTMNTFMSLKTQLDLWLARDVNQASFFTNFNRLVNPLLVNQSPTAVQVGTAVGELKRFYAYLQATAATAAGISTGQALDSILKTFVVEPVDAVDVLLRVFTEKGSDRATDFLLSGSFSAFFNLSVDGASYSGAFQEATRDVARNDLPVRRINRAETQSSRLISQAQSPDYEYTAASVSESVQADPVDPPGTFGEPSNYGKTT